MNLFTSEEIYVLSSLLGRDYVIGVEGNTLENNRSDLNTMFKKNFSELEYKGVFEYRIDGTLFIDRDVKKMVKVLNKADDIFVVVTDLSGKRKRVNFLCYGDIYCKLIDLGSRYMTEMMDSFSYESILDSYGISIPDNHVKDVSLSLSDLKTIDDLYKSFNVTEGDEHLSNLLSDTETENLIRDCLFKKSNAFVLKEYRRIGARLVNVNELILKFVNDHILRFYISGADTVNVRVY